MEALGAVKAKEILQTISVGRKGDDVLVWMPTRDGKFSSTLAWDIIRVRSPRTPKMSWIWHNLLPKTVLDCVWKARYNCLHVDENIRVAGIPIVSKCNCCTSSHCELRDHVLCSSKFAVSLWDIAKTALGIPKLQHFSWWAHFSQWIAFAKKSTTLSVIF